MKVLKMYCISESRIKKFPNVGDLLGSELLAAYTDVTTYTDAIKKYQKEKLEFKGRQVDGIFGPKSYGAISGKDSAFHEKLMSAFAQDAGFEDNIDPETIGSYYQPKYIKCPGRRGAAPKSKTKTKTTEQENFLLLMTIKIAKKSFNRMLAENKQEFKKNLLLNKKIYKILKEKKY